MGVNRREFLTQSATGLAAAAFASSALAQEAPPKAPPSERLRVGCVGIGGRGGGLLRGVASRKDVEIVPVCGVARRRLAGARAEVEKRPGRKPAVESDFRKLIDDKSIDAVAL